MLFHRPDGQYQYRGGRILSLTWGRVSSSSRRKAGLDIGDMVGHVYHVLMLVVRGAEEIWTGSRRLGDASLVCDAGRVKEVSLSPALPSSRADAEYLDASGCVVIPGLVNAHHHLLQTAFRTLSGTRHLSMGDWLAAMAGYYLRAGSTRTLPRRRRRWPWPKGYWQG